MITLKSKKGFTLVEIILVVLIIGFLAAIVIPRITYTTKEAKQAACDTTVANINTMIEYAYVKDSLAYPSVLSNFLANTTYFPDGSPVCPVSSACTWTYCTTTNRVGKHTH